jgi:SPP1 family predicted phage head-tail adaptor
MIAQIRARHARVTLQQPTRVADEIGGAAILWTEQGQVWATIQPTSASQSDAFDTRRATTAFRVTINRRDDIRAGWRLLWGARQLSIIGVSDGGAPRIVLTCEEERL